MNKTPNTNPTASTLTVADLAVLWDRAQQLGNTAGIACANQARADLEAGNRDSAAVAWAVLRLGTLDADRQRVAA